MLKNTSVLITGGTGSFGHSFVSLTLKKYNPKRLVIFSRDEMKQWEMAKLFEGDPRVRFFIGDVRDKDRLHRALHAIDYVEKVLHYNFDYVVFLQPTTPLRESAELDEAIKYCLKEADISFSDLDVVSSGWNPAYYMSKPGRSIWQTFRDRGLFLHYIVNELGSADYSDSISTVDQQLTLEVARMIREFFLQQNAFHDVDTYSDLKLQYNMAKAILSFT